MDVRQLRLFLAVIDQASVTKAAASLSLSSSAVSQQMRNLAAEMRAELFIRNNKRLVPTPMALLLAEHARSLLQHVDRVEREFKDEPPTPSRNFCLACEATTLVYRLGPPLRLLRERFPHITMRITVIQAEQMIAGVFDRRFDLGLVSLPLPTANLGVLPLYNEEMLILRPSTKRMRKWHVGAIQPSELAEAPFVLYPKLSNMRALIDRFLLDIGVLPKVTMEADDTGVIKGLVEAGFGYSVLPEFALHSGDRFFEVFRVPGKRIQRVQALVYVNPDNPHTLTTSIARFMKEALERRSADVKDSVSYVA